MGSPLRVEGFSDADFEPDAVLAVFLGSDSVGDPYPELARLREMGPVHEVDMRRQLGAPPDPCVEDLRKFAALDYATVREVFGRPEVYASRVMERTVGRMFGHVLTVMDPPEHPKYRPIFMKAFLPAVVSGWGDTLIDPIIRGLIARFRDRGRAELVREFAGQFSFLFVCRQLGLQPEDEATYMKLTSALLLVPIDPEHAAEASRKLGDYFAHRIAEVRGRAGDDMVTRLANAEVDGEYLPDGVLVSFLRQLMSAASETTYRATTNLLVGLLTHPDQLAAIREDRALIPQAVEEGLRWEPPVTFFHRVATRDTQLGGVTIPAGSLVEAWNGAANRDPQAFTAPDRFDIERRSSRHMAFSFGPHVCLGQHLAKFEIRRALHALLEDLPNLRLDPERPPPVITGINGRAAQAIHVRFG